MRKFFNGPHNKFYITDDNWKTYHLENNSGEAKLEENQDKTKEVIIREHYSNNVQKAAIIVQELKNINGFMLIDDYSDS